VRIEKKKSDENNTVRRYSADSNNTEPDYTQRFDFLAMPFQ